ncbi:DUF4123 domain-containing protein [Aeromonas enteropelogenes]|uniref:DUF4123 domain-containing protein n=1 Tax=Aeromonas enteropelogenes TaxID=29489 RepID=UPI001F17CFE4|nr:DUF4123 domain-containing protein [Aeromonas enteropelogenes]
MTLQEWRSQYPGQLFAIIDTALDTTAVADYCNQGGANAIPLFAGTAFADQAEQGPWLLPNPASEFIVAHPQLGGVYVASDAAIRDDQGVTDFCQGGSCVHPYVWQKKRW